MAKSLTVKIIGDPSDLSRSLKTATAETEGFGSKLGTVLKAGGLVAAAGIGVAAVAIDKSVKAAMAAEVSQAALSQALKNTHQSVAAMTPALEKAEEAGRKLGFTDNESRTALSRLETATKSTTKSIADLSVAQDIARFKHTDLTAASQMLAQAMTGSQRAAKQLGIVVSPVTDAVHKLRDAGIDNSTAMGRQQLAAAALTDKLATGQKVIEAVTEKVHGQAQAYAETASGGMATFGAQVDFMEEKLGAKLLPTLVNVMTWVNAHWPQIQAVFETVFHAVGVAIDFVTPYIEAFIAFSKKVVDRVRADWPQISAVITRVMDTVKSIISGAVTVAVAFWNRFGSTIISTTTTAVNAVRRVLGDLAGIVAGVINLVGDLIHGRWSKIWGDLTKIVKNAFDIVKTVITAAVSIVYQEAAAVGRAIVEGTISGLTSMASSAAHAVTGFFSGLIKTAKHAVGAKSPSTVFHQIGVDIMQGLQNGMAAKYGDIQTSVDHFMTTVSDAADRTASVVMKKVAEQTAAVAADWARMLKDTTAAAVGGPTAASDAANIPAAGAASAAAAQALVDYQNAYVDTTFATPGYSVGMSAAQVYALNNHSGDVVVQVGSDTLARISKKALLLDSMRGGTGIIA